MYLGEKQEIKVPILGIALYKRKVHPMCLYLGRNNVPVRKM